MDWGTIASILLGSALAVITSFITQSYSEWREKKRKIQHLKHFLTVELPLCVSKLESFIVFYEETKVPDPTTLVSLEHSSRVFSPYRDVVYQLNPDVAYKILDFYDSLERAIDIVQSMMKLLESLKHMDFAQQEIKKQIEELKRIKKIGETLRKDFRRTKRALDGWDSAAFSGFIYARTESCSRSLSTPAHPQVTLTVRPHNPTRERKQCQSILSQSQEASETQLSLP